MLVLLEYVARAAIAPLVGGPRADSDAGGTRLLGGPLGSSAYQAEWLRLAVANKRSATSCINALGDFQSEQILDRSCLWPSFLHPARLARRGAWDAAAREFDALITDQVHRWLVFHPTGAAL